MKRITPLVAVLLSTLAVGCSAEQLASLNRAASQAKDSPAISLATTTTIGQMAIFHVAAALSQAAAQDLGDGNVPSLTGTPRSDDEFKYEIDPQAGTGKVTRTHNGKRTVDLAFTYRGNSGNAGVAYTVTSTPGHFEGYQLLFPKLTLLYTALMGDNFHPLKHENGQFIFDVTVAAAGSMGVRGVETARFSSLSFNLIFPISDQEARIGEAQVIGQDGSTFEGGIFLAVPVQPLRG